MGALPKMRSSVMKKSTTMKNAMKTVKAMKAKRVSKVAKGKLGRAQVLRGTKEKTSSGLTKDKLMKNKSGKIVSAKQSAAGKKRYINTIKAWNECVAQARKALNLKGFVAINGKKVEGKALYAKAKALYAARK